MSVLGKKSKENDYCDLPFLLDLLANVQNSPTQSPASLSPHYFFRTYFKHVSVSVVQQKCMRSWTVFYWFSKDQWKEAGLREESAGKNYCTNFYTGAVSDHKHRKQILMGFLNGKKVFELKWTETYSFTAWNAREDMTILGCGIIFFDVVNGKSDHSFPGFFPRQLCLKMWRWIRWFLETLPLIYNYQDEYM